MIIVRCKECNTEITSNTKTQVCGCPNMMTVLMIKFLLRILAKLLCFNSDNRESKIMFSLDQELAYQEARRKRKVRKLDFEIKSQQKLTHECIVSDTK